MVDIFKICLLLVCAALLILQLFAAAAGVASVIMLALLLFPAAPAPNQPIKPDAEGGHRTDEWNDAD